MKFFHLSHTDLDGYSCQYISKKIFPDGEFYNANYGLEVKSCLNIITEKIRNSDDREIFFLITDLNLSMDEAKKLNSDITIMNNTNYKINLQLLDHHNTGSKCAKRYNWYFLDNNKSATKITYEYFLKNYEDFSYQCENNFDLLVESINAVDIWLENNKYFEFGKVCMSMISRAQEINNTLFSNENRQYKFFLLNKSLKYINLEYGYILLDENIYNHKKEYLKQEELNDSMDNLSSKYLVSMLNNSKNKLTINYKKHKGLLTYTLGNISITANRFLKENKNYDFFMNVNNRGRCSLRADGKLDVSQLASKIGNGGGHVNASGLTFDDWIKTIDYEEIKKYIQNKLDNIT